MAASVKLHFGNMFAQAFGWAIIANLILWSILMQHSWGEAPEVMGNIGYLGGTASFFLSLGLLALCFPIMDMTKSLSLWCPSDPKPATLQVAPGQPYTVCTIDSKGDIQSYVPPRGTYEVIWQPFHKRWLTIIGDETGTVLARITSENEPIVINHSAPPEAA